MNNNADDAAALPAWQKAIRDRCYHPSGRYIEFPPEAVDGSISDRFEETVRTFPDRLAVKSKGEELTYKQLNEAANRLAHSILQQFGVGQEPVALLLRQDIPLIVGIFGVLKTGKFYITLTPSLPQERLSSVLSNSEARLIVTDAEHLWLSKQIGDANTVIINIDELPAANSTEDVNVSVSPSDYAFVVYTSGSTGEPKGVIQTHRNLLHSLKLQTDYYHVCAEDRIIFIASAGRVVFRALLNGASIFPTSIKEYGTRGIVDFLIREQITMFHSVATAFRQVTSSMSGGDDFPHIRLVALVGETIEKQDFEIYKRHFSSDCIFVNSFGSSEWLAATTFFADKETVIDHSTVPVGYSSKDQEVMLLDENGNDVGFNEPGELTVRSRYLSPGYLRRPDLTEAAFSSENSKSDGQKTYRTGDLAIRLSDGCLVHMGRIDFQLKIRGNRVELAEVESALAEIEGVDEAVVAMRRYGNSDQRMIAYVVCKQSPPPTVSAMRRALAHRLPDFMVPSAFVRLDALPLIGIGKVDRRSLSEPSGARPELDTAYVGPRTPIEEMTVKIWGDILGVDGVGVHDNFLDLGGDSLHATRVISKVVQEFRVELPLHHLFESPTVANMAVVIAQHQTNTAGEEEVASILAELEALTDKQAKRMYSPVRSLCQ